MDVVKEFSVIKDGKVINRILCSDDFAVEYAKENGVEMSTSPEAAIGSEVASGKFAKPSVVTKAPGKSEFERLSDVLIKKGIITAAELSAITEVKK